MIIPEAGEYLWNWYHSVSDGCRRVFDGVCFPIPWTEFLAWAKATGEIVRPSEYVILRAVDVAFVSEMNIELQAYQERTRARQAAEVEAGRRR